MSNILKREREREEGETKGEGERTYRRILIF